MEIDITVDDPKAYTKSWTVRHLQDIMLDTDIIEFHLRGEQPLHSALTA